MPRKISKRKKILVAPKYKQTTMHLRKMGDVRPVRLVSKQKASVPSSPSRSGYQIPKTPRVSGLGWK